jgi:hypothetical protein
MIRCVQIRVKLIFFLLPRSVFIACFVICCHEQVHSINSAVFFVEFDDGERFAIPTSDLFLIFFCQLNVEHCYELQLLMIEKDVQVFNHFPFKCFQLFSITR